MAAAGYYADRFGDRAGIIYAAGVDHAENVAQALRAAGVKAKSVSGRTPPRVLAETLAAYERGETNVLVNAQLLAEGWNAPRATICMHLAPTASRRVYQQRVGRVMRLHRRKEAGVVVDFADPAAPHSDRTVTLHSLLDADVYRPGALVTPRPPRRRQRWRRTARPVVREVDWFVPVADDPERRRAAIVADWKSVAADMLPADEQELWAETAARRVAPPDLTRLTATLAKVSEETRIAFFATCAAECKHRALRLAALGDLASRHPDPNTVERVVRLIEAAPTWAADRAQGARVLLLALGEGGFAGSLSQRVAWMWRLAKASREVQFRVATAGSTQARDLLRAMAAARGEDHHLKAKLLVLAASQADLPHGAAMLAVAVVHDSTAGRLIDNARVAMGEDPESLALALASNIPAQTERARPKTRRRRVKSHAAGTPAVAAVKAAPPVAPKPAEAAAGRRGRERRGERRRDARPRRSRKPGDAPPSRSKRRRRRRRKRREAEVATAADARRTETRPTRASPPAERCVSLAAPWVCSPACRGRHSARVDPGGRRGHAARPDHAHGGEAARARRQQAGPVLRARVDARRGHPRGRHHRRRHAGRDPRRGRRRLGVRARRHLHPAGRAARARARRADRRGLPRGRAVRDVPRRQPARRRHHRARRGVRARPPRRADPAAARHRPELVRHRRARPRGPGHPPRREAEGAARPTSRSSACTCSPTRSGSRSRRSSPPRAASSRSRTRSSTSSIAA